MTPELFEKYATDALPAHAGVYLLSAFNPFTYPWIIYVGLSWDVATRYEMHLKSIFQSRDTQHVHQLMSELGIAPKIILLADCGEDVREGIMEVIESLVMACKQTLHDRARQDRKDFVIEVCGLDDGLADGAEGGNGVTSIFRNITHKPNSYCDECEEDFGSKTGLRDHNKAHHPPECPACGKQCTRTQYLLEHMQACLNLRGYACADCPAKFNTSKGPANHKASVHLKIMRTCKRVDKECRFQTTDRGCKGEHQKWLCEYCSEKEMRANGVLVCGLGACDKEFDNPSRLAPYSPETKVKNPADVFESAYENARLHRCFVKRCLASSAEQSNLQDGMEEGSRTAARSCA